MSKKILKLHVEDFYASTLDSYTLTQARDYLNDLITRHGPDATLDWDYDQYRFAIELIREETDQEYALRTRQEENRINTERLKERIQLWELLKKHPDILDELKKQG